MSKVKNVKEEKIENLITDMKKISKDQAIIASAIQYKKSQEIIARKVNNENVAISYGISLINKKVIENLDKYSEIENELKSLMSKYQENLEELANYHDSQIVLGYTKIYEEEIKQLEIQNKIYDLIKQENKAREKADNSDDEIREEICDLEDELNKIELKIRRLKPIIKKKIQDKELELDKAIESTQTALQKEKIKGPRIFSKATKFFMGRIKPHKLIEKNVFSNLKERLEKYENEKNIKKINEKYLEPNIVETINNLTKTEEN